MVFPQRKSMLSVLIGATSIVHLCSFEAGQIQEGGLAQAFPSRWESPCSELSFKIDSWSQAGGQILSCLFLVQTLIQACQMGAVLQQVCMASQPACRWPQQSLTGGSHPYLHLLTLGGSFCPSRQTPAWRQIFSCHYLPLTCKADGKLGTALASAHPAQATSTSMCLREPHDSSMPTSSCSWQHLRLEGSAVQEMVRT